MKTVKPLVSPEILAELQQQLAVAAAPAPPCGRQMMTRYLNGCAAPSEVDQCKVMAPLGLPEDWEAVRRDMVCTPEECHLRSGCASLKIQH